MQSSARELEDVEVKLTEKLETKEMMHMEHKQLIQEVEHSKMALEMVREKIDTIKQSGNTGTLVMRNFELRLKKDKGGFMDKMDPKVYLQAGETELVLEEKTNAGTHACWPQ